MTEGRPLVSVVLPCRDAERYIRAALESILEQSYRELEILIIDNASADTTPEIVTGYAAADPRIRYLRNETDIGIAGSLNRGLREATGELIARMDADDIALSERLAKQVAYLEANPNCVICGTNIVLINADDEEIGRREFGTDDADIKRRMLIDIPFCHPATMFRRQAVVEGGVYYDEQWRTVEDRDFWLRLADHGLYANIPEDLMRYRISETSMKYAECRRTVYDIVRLQLRWAFDPRFRGVRNLVMIAAESALLLLPRRVITYLYKLRYSI